MKPYKKENILKLAIEHPTSLEGTGCCALVFYQNTQSNKCIKGLRDLIKNGKKDFSKYLLDEEYINVRSFLEERNNGKIYTKITTKYDSDFQEMYPEYHRFAIVLPDEPMVLKEAVSHIIDKKFKLSPSDEAAKALIGKCVDNKKEK